MLISEFARRTGLGRETIRFYVRLGLLRPSATRKGGHHPYLAFTEEDVKSADTIRAGQALGLSLREIASLKEARREGGLPLEKRMEIMQDLLVRLENKSAELNRLKTYVRAKFAWQSAGEEGDEPRLGSFD